MLEAISWATVGELTPHALWMGAVVLIFTGKLHTNSAYQILKEQKTYWRETAEKLRDTNHLLTKTVEKQEIASDTIIKVMDSVQDANRPDGGEKP